MRRSQMIPHRPKFLAIFFIGGRGELPERLPTPPCIDPGPLHARLEARHEVAVQGEKNDGIGNPLRFARTRQIVVFNRIVQGEERFRNRNTSSTLPCSTMLPIYMTITSSASSATTPMSWVISMMAV